MDISRWIDRNADFFPGKPAILFDGKAISYADFARRIAAAAHALAHGLHLQKGERIAYLGHNSVEQLVLTFAAARLGLLMVPLNWRLAAEEHRFIMHDAETAVLFFDHHHLAHVTKNALHEVCTSVSVGCEAPGMPSLDSLTKAAGDSPPPSWGDDEDPFLVVYTSGTTGRPKGAVLKQKAMFYNAVNSGHCFDITAQDRVLTSLPMFHVGGLNIQTLPALHAGATVILLERFDAGAVIAAIRTERPTLMLAVPAALQALLVHPDWTTTDLSCLRSIGIGSSDVPRPLLDAGHALGIPMVQVYGSTETAPTAIYLRAEDAMSQPGSMGKPALHCEIRVVDADGQDVAVGERGEILVRGPNVMTEYWRNPEATAAALKDGWFHTGDCGYVDAEGFYWFTDRLKNMIISGGENIYPAELERILQHIPGVAEFAVIGRRDERWGEVPVAVVVPSPGVELTKEAVLAGFEGKLARFKLPRDVVFRKSLPRTALGKVQHFQLKATLESEAKNA